MCKADIGVDVGAQEHAQVRGRFCNEQDADFVRRLASGLLLPGTDMFQRTGDRQARKLRLKKETMRTLVELGPHQLAGVVSGYHYKPSLVCDGDQLNGGGNSVRCR